MFSKYDFSTTFPSDMQGRRIVLELRIPSYQFEDFHAKVAVEATVYDEKKNRLVQKTYKAEGVAQGGKMFWGGAFAMKSAIRQSSLDAFKKVFEQLRADVAAAVARRSS